MHKAWLCIGTFFIAYTSVFAQQTSTYREYEKTLSDFISQDQKYREQIAQEQALIIDYKKKLKESQKRIEKIRQQKLSFLGVSHNHIQDIADMLTEYFALLTSFSVLNDQKFTTEKNRIDSLHLIISSLQSDPVIKIPRIKKQLSSVTSLINEYKQRLATIQTAKTDSIMPEQTYQPQPPPIETYIVGSSTRKAETLFNIAAKVYGDPFRWPELYQANKEAMDSNFKKFNHSKKSSTIMHPSDLILPGQVLYIPHTNK